MAASATTLQQLQLGAESLREQKVPPPRPVITDKVEALASSMTPKSAEWLRRNPECATDERLKQKMIAAHHLVVADGFEIESPAYFREVERVIGLNKEHDYDPTTDAAQVTQRRTPAPAAPVSRGSDGRGSASKTVTLSAAEREIASDMGMTEREYAKNKYQLQREGKLSK
jgi:CRISPR/Cas system-associated endonuclease/helicase Cas3